MVNTDNILYIKKKESSEPSNVTRLKVWVKSRTKKDGTLVNTDAAEKIVSCVFGHFICDYYNYVQS